MPLTRFNNYPVTRNLIILNIILYLAELVLPRIGIDLVHLLGLHHISSSDFKIHQLITYAFLHSPSSFSHILFNMFPLYMFGIVLEHIWGSRRFLIYYLVTALGAALVQEGVWLITPSTNNPFIWDYLITIGASGSVFGILLAYGMLFPNTPLYLMFIPIPIKAKWFVLGYGLIELFMGITYMNGGGSNVAHFAHLGGMLFGFLLLLVWREQAKRGKF